MLAAFVSFAAVANSLPANKRLCLKMGLFCQEQEVRVPTSADPAPVNTPEYSAKVIFQQNNTQGVFTATGQLFQYENSSLAQLQIQTPPGQDDIVSTSFTDHTSNLNYDVTQTSSGIQCTISPDTPDETGGSLQFAGYGFVSEKLSNLYLMTYPSGNKTVIYQDSFTGADTAYASLTNGMAFVFQTFTAGRDANHNGLPQYILPMCKKGTPNTILSTLRQHIKQHRQFHRFV